MENISAVSVKPRMTMDAIHAEKDDCVYVCVCEFVCACVCLCVGG